MEAKKDKAGTACLNTKTRKNQEKPGKTGKSPLGIPVMIKRAQQALVKSALEPEWESQLEVNSYGFRPGRSPQDAIEAIFNAVRYKTKFVLDADIKGCFDAINQEELLKKIKAFPQMRQSIKGWLKAGVIDKNVFTPTEAGTPQGGLCKALHKLPYAKWKAMQSKCKKSLKLLHCGPIYFA